ncbi:MAG: hypothetical protein PWQ57_192 [Desulfovibrionales bacterium]|nr:hypothetical protein [Desulfovibrionales bacterium]
MSKAGGANAPTPSLEDMRVLVADDASSVRRIIASMLSRYGVQHVLEASNGAEALEILERRPVDIIIADRSMPNMDGQELLEQVRAHPLFGETPFLMVTQEADKSYVLDAIRAGVTDYLLKPISAPGLFAKINEIRQSLRGPAKLLLVDDSQASLSMIKAMLLSSGNYKMSVASSAVDALRMLERLASRNSGELPDLVLMDVVMPEMDGVEGVWAMNLDQRLRSIPVIMVSARDEEETLQRAFEAGAVDYIARPVSRVELQTRVQAALRLKSERDQRMQREQELLLRLEQIQEANCFDYATNALNRRAFEECLRREWGRAAREKRSLGVILLEFVGWSQCCEDDPEFGDDILRLAAEACSRCLKRHGDVLARVGEARLGMILAETGAEGVSVVAEQALAKVSAVEELNRYGLAPALGAAVAQPTPGLQRSSIVRAADMALFEALGQGGGLILAGEKT